MFDIVYFEVTASMRGSGVGRAALRWITSHFGKLLRPIDVAPDAAGFWKKMSLEGLVLFDDWRE